MQKKAEIKKPKINPKIASNPKLPTLKKQQKSIKRQKKKSIKASNIFELDIENCFKNLSKSTSKDKISTKLKIPQKITKLNTQTISMDNITDDTYEKKLISYLQENLELPEIGSVKAEITINNMGKINKLTILQPENNENVRYLKNQLHQLIYPCFNSNEFDQTTKSYIINFNSLR